MSFDDAQELINYAFRERVEEVIRKRWIINYEKTMSLTEFKQALGIKEELEEDKEVEDILLELKNVFG